MPAVPLPLQITAGALPWGFKGNLQALFGAFTDALSAELDPTFLTGQTGGAQPTHDIGPWSTSDGWWFWDPATGQYQPSDQGSPVGTMVMWGGTATPLNNNWLLCDGREVARDTYSRLFQAIGETWGPGDGQNTFNLPPAAKLFMNAPGWVADVNVPTDPKPDGTFYLANGVNGRGGQQAYLLVGQELPGMWAKPINFVQPTFAPQDGQYIIDNIQGPILGPTPDKTMDQPVFDSLGPFHRIGLAQTGVPIMPPYVLINYIIKIL